MIKCAVLALAISLLRVGAAVADPFTIRPDGNLVFNVAVSSSAFFTCSPLIPCTGSGTSSVVLGTGSSTATLVFTGVDTAVQLGGHALTLVTLGRIDSFASPDFTFPAYPNPNVDLLRLTLSVNQSSPVAGTARVVWAFGPGGGPALPVLSGHSYLAFATGPNPPGFNYNTLVYSFTGAPLRIPANGTFELAAQAGAIPEPATLLLTATGMAAIRWARRRKRVLELCAKL